MLLLFSGLLPSQQHAPQVAHFRNLRTLCSCKTQLQHAKFKRYTRIRIPLFAKKSRFASDSARGRVFRIRMYATNPSRIKAHMQLLKRWEGMWADMNYRKKIRTLGEILRNAKNLFDAEESSKTTTAFVTIAWQGSYQCSNPEISDFDSLTKTIKSQTLRCAKRQL